MAAVQNVEAEAAKFLQKLIHESKDEPAKLATKLYVILQHLTASGKENSMPYQVISKAMETIINDHGLDFEALKSSRLPTSGGPQIGESIVASTPIVPKHSQMPKQKMLVQRSYELEPGEIDPAPRAKKIPRAEESPHPSVASASLPPAELAGHATRNQSGEREVCARRLSPTTREQTRKLKRSGGHYSGSKLARLCLGPMHHSSAAVPQIANFPEPKMGIMLSEDNALAAVQAVATSQQADLDHYMDFEENHLKDWIFRDLKINLSRTMVAAEAAQRMFLDKDRESFDRFHNIYDLEVKEKELQAEIKALHDRVDHEREKLRKDRERLKEVQAELATERFKNEGFESKLKDTKEKLAAAEEKLKETVDLEKIRSTYFDEWLSEWADTKEGEDWLHDVSKSARAMAFWEAL